MMSGAINGYVFPRPCLPPPPFEAGSLLASPLAGARQGYPYAPTGNNGRYLQPGSALVGQDHSWSQNLRPSFPPTVYQPQFIPRMQKYGNSPGLPQKGPKHFVPQGPFCTEPLHCKGSGRPFKHINNRHNDHHKKNEHNQFSAMSNSGIKFFCEPCEKEFKSENDKIAHIKQHVKCEVEGCSFVASRKTVKLHFIQKHEVGKFRIVLKNDDDIEKWREERKKNYPSASRKNERLAEEEAKKSHGIVLRKREFSYRGNGKWNRWNSDRNKTCIKEQSKHSPKSEVRVGEKRKSEKLYEEKEMQKSNINDLNEEPVIPTKNGLESLRHMYDSSENEESDNESTALPDHKKNLKQSIKSKSLTTKDDKEQLDKEQLGRDVPNSAKRESESELETNELPFKPKDDFKTKMANSRESMNDSTLSERDIKNGRVCGNSIEYNAKLFDQNLGQRMNENKIYENSRKRKYPEKDKRSKQNAISCYHKHRPTLLEMLLANDIKHERNTILQCIRFLTRNRFLNIELK